MSLAKMEEIPKSKKRKPAATTHAERSRKRADKAAEEKMFPQKRKSAILAIISRHAGLGEYKIEIQAKDAITARFVRTWLTSKGYEWRMRPHEGIPNSFMITALWE